MNQQYVIGIDIGGTTSVVGLVDEQGHIVAERSFDTQSYAEPLLFVQAIRRGIEEMVTSADLQVRLCGIGVGAPNGNFYNGRIEYAPNMPWKGVVDLAGIMEEAMDMPVVLTNDANAAAVGEKRFGAAKGLDDFVVVTIGTGLGSGIVANGELIYGNTGFAGELGHTNTVRDGRECTCGRKGCLEAYVSARGLQATYNELRKECMVATPGQELPADGLSARAIYHAALQGDSMAIQAFEYTGMILGRHLADLVAINSPEVIFLFGGLAASGELLLQPTRKHLAENLLQVFKGRVRVELSTLEGKSAAVKGAAALAWEVLCVDEPAHEPT